MKIKVFGKLTDIFQSDEYTLEQEVSTVSELKEKLEVQFPELKTYNYLIVVDNQNAKDSDSIQKESEVALLPPYSGG